MIIIFDTNKQFKYSYITDRDYITFNDTFLINTLKALDYLYKNNFLTVKYKNTNTKMDIIDILVDETEEPVYIRQYISNKYSPSTNTIFFNDTQGATFRKNYRKRFTTKNMGFNSPAGLLSHELIHCYHELYDKDNYLKRKKNKQTKGKKIVPSGTDLSYPNKEEELVILLSNQVLKQMGEDIRTNYGRNYYDVANVLSTDKKDIS